MKNPIKSTGKEVTVVAFKKIVGRKCKFSYVEEVGGAVIDAVCHTVIEQEWHPDKDDRVLIFSNGNKEFVEPCEWLPGEQTTETQERCDRVVSESRKKEKDIEAREAKRLAAIEDNEREQKKLRRLVVKTPVESDRT